VASRQEDRPKKGEAVRKLHPAETSLSGSRGEKRRFSGGRQSLSGEISLILTSEGRKVTNLKGLWRTPVRKRSQQRRRRRERGKMSSVKALKGELEMDFPLE